VLACTFGCGGGDRALPREQAPNGPSESAQQGAQSGSLSFALTTPNGWRFDDFSYTVTGPNFSKAGDVDVSNSTTVIGSAAAGRRKRVG
jgi:hypothetical protein